MKKIMITLSILFIGSAFCVDIHAQSFSITQVDSTIIGFQNQGAFTGDFNGDGKDDVILLARPTNWYSQDGQFYCYLQEGDTLNDPISTRYVGLNLPGYGPNGFAGASVYDFNADGMDDFVVNYRDSLKVYHSVGDGSFILEFGHPNEWDPTSGWQNAERPLAIGDLSKDGIPDIVYTYGDDSLRVLLGICGGGFQNPFAFYFPSHNQGYLFIDSLSGEHNILFHCDYSPNTYGVRYIITDSTGYPETVGLLGCINPNPVNKFHGADVVDRDGDGNRELAMLWVDPNTYTENVAFFDGTHLSYTTSNESWDPGFLYWRNVPMTAANMDCTIGEELIVYSINQDMVIIYQDTTVHINLPVQAAGNVGGLTSQTLATGDYNSDGTIDIAVANYDRGLFIVYNELPAIPTSTDVLRDTLYSQMYLDTTSVTYDTTTYHINLGNCARKDSMVYKAYYSLDEVYDYCILQKNILVRPSCNDTIIRGGSNFSEASITAKVDSSVSHQVVLYNLDSISLDFDFFGDTLGVLPIGGGGPYSYIWSNSETGQWLYNVTPGIYSVLVTDTFGCFTEDSIVIEDSLLSGVESILTRDIMVNIYPSPTQDVLNISFSKDGIYEIALYDIAGKLLRQKQADGAIVIFEMGDLSNGVYFVHMSDGSHSKVTKIVKK